jgi:hypothetical protein
VIGILFFGGLGWVLLGRAIWGLYLAYGPAKVASRSKELRLAWESRTGHRELVPPKGMYIAWRDEADVTGISAADWLDRVMDRVAPRPQRIARILDDLEVAFFLGDSGNPTWACSRVIDPTDPMAAFIDMRVEIELTKWQLTTGQEPLFRRMVDRAKAEMADAPESSQA